MLMMCLIYVYVFILEVADDSVETRYLRMKIIFPVTLIMLICLMNYFDLVLIIIILIKHST